MRGNDLVRKALAVALAISGTAPAGFGQQQQQQPIDPMRPSGFVAIRPYKTPITPPIRMQNSLRFRDLIHGGNLYLTAQDAIALALENNIDIESARYTRPLDEWNLQCAEAGGALPGIPSASSQAGTQASGQGVLGSQAAAGVSTSGANTTQGNTVGATISQIGPVTPTLDPVVQDVQTFTHRSVLFANTTQLGPGFYNLQVNTRNYNVNISQGLITGGTVRLAFSNSYQNENAPSDVLNPSNATQLNLTIQHNFLQGFGTAVLSRNITIARTNLQMDDLNFKNDVISVIANVLNLYYGLVADYQDVKAKQSAVEVARQFYQNNRKQVEIGTMAPLDVTTAEAQVASTQQDFVISQTALEQQQVQLKNVLSRDGLNNPLLREVNIIPVDRIDVPEKDNLPPLNDLIRTALTHRPDIAVDKLNLQNAQVNALGTANGVLPQLAGLAGASTQGLSGNPQTVVIRSRQPDRGAGSIPQGFEPCPPNIPHPPGSLCEVADPYFIGGIGTALGQTIRRNFPSEHAGFFIAPTLRNRQAQADYAIDQLGLRQTELENVRSANQVAVDVSNQMVGLEQSRARYQAAVHNRILQEQLLDAEQKKFALGASTTFNVVQEQRDLATTQSSEVAALVSYSNARIALDETLGTTLESNHVTVDEARAGHVNRASTLPAVLPSMK